MDSKTAFSFDVKTSRIVCLEKDGVFTHGAPDPTRLEIRAIDDRGEIQVLIFEQKAFEALTGVLRCLAKAFPDAFPR